MSNVEIIDLSKQPKQIFQSLKDVLTDEAFFEALSDVAATYELDGRKVEVFTEPYDGSKEEIIKYGPANNSMFEWSRHFYGLYEDLDKSIDEQDKAELANVELNDNPLLENAQPRRSFAMFVIHLALSCPELKDFASIGIFAPRLSVIMAQGAIVQSDYEFVGIN